MPIALIQQARWWCPMCGTDGVWGGTMMMFMMLFWVLVVVGIAWLLFRWGADVRGRGSPPAQESPEEILKARFARGEIDEESYGRMRAELRE